MEFVLSAVSLLTSQCATSFDAAECCDGVDYFNVYFRFVAGGS